VPSRRAPNRFDAVVSVRDALQLVRALRDIVSRPSMLLATASMIDISVDAPADA